MSDHVQPKTHKKKKKTYLIMSKLQPNVKHKYTYPYPYYNPKVKYKHTWPCPNYNPQPY